MFRPRATPVATLDTGHGGPRAAETARLSRFPGVPTHTGRSPRPRQPPGLMEPTSSLHHLRPHAPTTPFVERPPVAPVVGMPLALTDYERAMDWMDSSIARRERAIVTAAAVHLVMKAGEDPETQVAVDRDDVLAVPDGQPLVWALKALGNQDASRVYGPDLMAKYCERSAQTGTRMYLYGGRNQGALVQLTLMLRRRYPGLPIPGGSSPPLRPPPQTEPQWAIDGINRSRPA